MSNTTAKSGNSLKKAKRGAKSKVLERPFEDSLLRQAKRIVDDYSIVIKKDNQLGFVGSALEIPTVFADGRTHSKCYQATRDALVAAVATMLECGRKPPLASPGRKRTVQVNIRLTPQEKLILSNASTDLGFRGISDFIRNCALARIHSA